MLLRRILFLVALSSFKTSLAAIFSLYNCCIFAGFYGSFGLHLGQELLETAVGLRVLNLLIFVLEEAGPAELGKRGRA